jgi:hypothetical protein
MGNGRKEMPFRVALAVEGGGLRSPIDMQNVVRVIGEAFQSKGNSRDHRYCQTAVRSFGDGGSGNVG